MHPSIHPCSKWLMIFVINDRNCWLLQFVFLLCPTSFTSRVVLISHPLQLPRHPLDSLSSQFHSRVPFRNRNRNRNMSFTANSASFASTKCI
jgi:hypothetical protein